MNVRKAVIPAAGLGTRFLPVTKAVPKELLPIIDRPSIQYVIEEAVQAGIEEIILVTSRGKEALVNYFDHAPDLERTLSESGNQRALGEVQGPARMAKFVSVRQLEPMGLGHAVLTARPAVGNEPFAVLLPDDIVDGDKPLLGELIEVFNRHKGSVVAVEEVPEDKVSSYGIVGGREVAPNVMRLNALVEKPKLQDAPSRMAIVGRYVFTPDIFDILERTPKGAKGEIQLTDAMAELMRRQAHFAYRFNARRYDTGNPLGLLEATLGYALKRPDLAGPARAMIRRMLEEQVEARR